jgi:hypothetical protein
MRCGKCGAENPEDAYFCGTCGVQLRSNFGSAGAPDSAAASEAPAGPSGERLDPSANPFEESEPTARAAYASTFGTTGEAATPPPPPRPGPPPPPRTDIHSPGAGLTPPPPMSEENDEAPTRPVQLNRPDRTYPVGHAGSYAAPQVGPPVQGYGPGYAPPPVYTGQPGMYPPPPGGNTSGMGDGYPVPPQAKGWNFGGFVPFGLFAFMNGNTTWGVLGAIGSFVSILGLVYAIYIGASGKEMAWKGKRFTDLAEYETTMRGWNIAGLIMLGLSVFFVIAYFVFLFVIIGAAAMSDAASPTTY